MSLACDYTIQPILFRSVILSLLCILLVFHFSFFSSFFSLSICQILNWNSLTSQTLVSNLVLFKWQNIRTNKEKSKHLLMTKRTDDFCFQQVCRREVDRWTQFSAQIIIRIIRLYVGATLAAGQASGRVASRVPCYFSPRSIWQRLPRSSAVRFPLPLALLRTRGSLSSSSRPPLDALFLAVPDLKNFVWSFTNTFLAVFRDIPDRKSAFPPVPIYVNR